MWRQSLHTLHLQIHNSILSTVLDKFEKDTGIKFFQTSISSSPNPPHYYSLNINVTQIKAKNKNQWLLPAWDNWIHFQDVWFLINNDTVLISNWDCIKKKKRCRTQNVHKALLFQAPVLWIVINGNNSIISSLCEMLKLAKGTHILGLSKTGSHGTISQYFFGSYPERELINDPPIHNKKAKSNSYQ